MQLTPCNYGKRALAYIIDVLFILVPCFIAFIVSITLLFEGSLRPIGFLLALASLVWLLGAGIWNQIIRQGKTGQTVGKSHQQIQLISIKTGLVPGVGIVFIRVIVGYVFNALTFGIFGIVDLLFPAFDKQKQRIVDKICSTMVIDAEKTSLTPASTTGTNWTAPTKQTLNDPLE